MMKLQLTVAHLYWQIAGIVVSGINLVALSASANCNDQIAGLDITAPAMQRIWNRLRQQTQFPWGAVNPYKQLTEDRIEFTADFEQLTGPQKQQAIAALKLEYSSNWFNELTAEEQQAALKSPGMGAIPFYKVYGSDARALSLPYDGCTRMTLLTEKDRFSWYYNQLNRSPSTSHDQALLRNSGHPPWRTVRFAITAAAEQDIRLKFWRTVGFRKANQGWWIAWVPELGHFEVNVPQPFNLKDLQIFWQLAPVQYRYRIVASDGTPISEQRPKLPQKR